MAPFPSVFLRGCQRRLPGRLAVSWKTPPTGEYGESTKTDRAGQSAKVSPSFNCNSAHDGPAWSPGFPFPLKSFMHILFYLSWPHQSLSTESFPHKPLNKMYNPCQCFLHRVVFSNTSATNRSRTDQISYICFQILEIFSKSCLFFFFPFSDTSSTS